MSAGVGGANVRTRLQQGANRTRVTGAGTDHEGGGAVPGPGFQFRPPGQEQADGLFIPAHGGVHERIQSVRVPDQHAGAPVQQGRDLIGAALHGGPDQGRVELLILTGGEVRWTPEKPRTNHRARKFRPRCLDPVGT